MSAIAGLFSFNRQPVDTDALSRMSNALTQHGPDAQRSWHAGSIGLLHRLMRITPEDLLERQPLTSADGRYVLVADARVDNRDELCATFGWKSEALRFPDSRFVLEAWLRWSSDCGRQLVGNYTIAVWDNLQQQLTLIRDPAGGRTLHYFHNEHFFAFASMPKGLFAVPKVPRELNEEKLADFLVLNHRDHRTTHYKDIYRLAPGHCLQVSADARIKETCYWQPDFDARLTLNSDDEYAEAFDELFNKVVRSLLRSRTPVSAFMSGGLDSSSIAVTAADILRESGQRLTTFTHVPKPGFNGPVPRGRYADESDRVKKIAAMYDNIDINLITPNTEEALTENIAEHFDYTELPFRNPANRQWMEAILQAQRENGSKVILDGTFGNFTYTWHGYHSLPFKLKQGKLWSVLKECRAIAHHQHRPWWRVFAGQAVLPLAPGLRFNRHNGAALWSRVYHDTPWAWHSAIHPNFARDTAIKERGRHMGVDFRFAVARDTRRLRWLGVVAADFAADIYTGWKARFGVEARFPATDRRLVEFCLAIPEEQFLHQGIDRRLARQVFQGRLPAEILNSRQRGLQSPDWFEQLERHKQQLSADLERMAGDPEMCRYLDIDRLQHLLHEWPTDWADSQATSNYRLMLSRAVIAGRFIRWFEGDNQ